MGTDVRHLLPISISELQRRLGKKSYSHLWQYVAGRKDCPAEVVVEIERVTGVVGLRSEMRPDLWPREEVEVASGG